MTVLQRTKASVLVAIIIILMTGIVLFPARYPDIAAREQLELSALRIGAYNYAVECSGTVRPELLFNQIRWVVVPVYRLRMETTDAGTMTMRGYFNVYDSTIYMPYPLRKESWIMTHEILHAIGYTGHPEVPFSEPCRVSADQN